MANFRIVRHGTKEVLISYKTVVAAFDYSTGACYKTNHFYSRTTSRHINKYIPTRAENKVFKCTPEFLLRFYLSNQIYESEVEIKDL